jgi:hypothetical protein
MVLLSIVAAIIISLAMTDRASGGFVGGNDLYATCTDRASRLECVGYVMGVLDAASSEAVSEQFQQGRGVKRDRPDINEATLSGFRWCLRETVTVGQAVDVITNFLHDNPAYRDNAAPGLVAMAMQRAWPCGRP